MVGQRGWMLWTINNPRGRSWRISPLPDIQFSKPDSVANLGIPGFVEPRKSGTDSSEKLGPNIRTGPGSKHLDLEIASKVGPTARRN